MQDTVAAATQESGPMIAFVGPFIAGLLGAITAFSLVGGVLVFRQSFRRMVADKQHYLDVGGYVAMIVPVLIGLISAAIILGGFALKIITDGASGLAWIFGSILGPLVGLPQIGKFAKGDSSVSIEKVEKITTTENKTGSGGGGQGTGGTTS